MGSIVTGFGCKPETGGELAINHGQIGAFEGANPGAGVERVDVIGITAEAPVRFMNSLEFLKDNGFKQVGSGLGIAGMLGMKTLETGDGAGKVEVVKVLKCLAHLRIVVHRIGVDAGRRGRAGSRDQEGNSQRQNRQSESAGPQNRPGRSLVQPLHPYLM